MICRIRCTYFTTHSFLYIQYLRCCRVGHSVGARPAQTANHFKVKPFDLVSAMLCMRQLRTKVTTCHKGEKERYHSHENICTYQQMLIAITSNYGNFSEHYWYVAFRAITNPTMNTNLINIRQLPDYSILDPLYWLIALILHMLRDYSSRYSTVLYYIQYTGMVSRARSRTLLYEASSLCLGGMPGWRL